MSSASRICRSLAAVRPWISWAFSYSGSCSGSSGSPQGRDVNTGLLHGGMLARAVCRACVAWAAVAGSAPGRGGGAGLLGRALGPALGHGRREARAARQLLLQGQVRPVVAAGLDRLDRLAELQEPPAGGFQLRGVGVVGVRDFGLEPGAHVLGA